jgi:hypothetical protein
MAAAAPGIQAPPWTIHRKKADHLYLRPAAECKPIVYGKPDNVITFDRLSSVFVSNTNHAEDQPPHLTLKDPAVPVQVNLARYAGPEADTAPPASTSSSTTTAPSGCRSTRRTASTARPATSRTRPRTSSGCRPRAAGARPTSACEKETSMENPPIEVLTAARLWPPMMESLRGRFQVHDRNHQSDAAAFAPPRRGSARSPRAASRRCRAS